MGYLFRDLVSSTDQEQMRHRHTSAYVGSVKEGSFAKDLRQHGRNFRKRKMLPLSSRGWSTASRRCRPGGLVARGRDAAAKRRVKEAPRAFSAQNAVDLADRCHQHILSR
jgi:hypothetical protein